MSEHEDSRSYQKLSQRRVDRQKRKAERQLLKQKKAHFDKEQEQHKVVKPRLRKKSLPGFLANNVDAILHWLKDYETLFNLADDYGFQRIDRMPEEKMQRLVQQYVDISEFIDKLEAIKAEADLKLAREKENAQPETEQKESEDHSNSSLEVNSSLQDSLVLVVS